MAALAAGAALGLAGCGGGSHPPHVASLGTTTTAGDIPSAASPPNAGSSPTTVTAGSSPTQLLDEWGSCMRAHGLPNQADPTIDTNNVIHLSWDDATPGGIYGTYKGGQGNSGPGQYCRTYIDTAITDLQSSSHLHPPSQTQVLQYSKCMRANDVPDFPDPNGDGSMTINRGGSGDLSLNSPVFQSASKLCAAKTGVQGLGGGGTPPPGAVVFNGDNPGGPNG